MPHVTQASLQVGFDAAMTFSGDWDATRAHGPREGPSTEILIGLLDITSDSSEVSFTSIHYNFLIV